MRSTSAGLRDLREVLGQLSPALHVTVAQLAGGHVLDRGGDVVLPAASTVKLVLGVAVARGVDAGAVGWDEHVEVRRSFHSAAGGRFALAAADDDAELAARDSGLTSVTELLDRALTMSSNLAANLLIERVGLAALQDAARELGATDTVVQRPFGDRAGVAAGCQNVTTTDDMARVMARIARADLGTSAAVAGWLQDLLLRQRHREYLPAALPPGTRVANKTGWSTEVVHDIATIWPVDAAPYVVAVCVADPDRSAAIMAVRLLSEQVYRRRHELAARS